MTEIMYNMTFMMPLVPVLESFDANGIINGAIAFVRSR